MEETQAAEELPEPPIERPDFRVVGLGASAGGLEPLEEFFDAMPSDTGMAFVVVQHLSPDFKSHMEELLGRHTTMAIHRVQDGMLVEPNCIYLIPPRTQMVISRGKLLLKDTEAGERAFAHPIDHFFRSLAADVGGRAIAVVLSGTGSDGSRGIQDIHDVGGLVVVQDERSAKFDGMPMNALATGVVDVVLPPSEIAETLVRYAVDGVSRQQLAAEDKRTADREGIERIFQLLNQQHGLDFSHYKASTVGRRIQRRIELRNVESLDRYIREVETDPAELNSLYKDLLIGVTKFFRDPEAFAVLEERVIPKLFAQARDQKPIRVWIAGCASGEEAYSIAILLDEERRRRHSHAEIKVFATDAHHVSLNTAAQGIYDEDSLSELSAERRGRYFRKQRDGYHVIRELRQYVVFAPHNVIRDSPFTQMDLVSCRNLLIYLQPQAQRKALSTFHFALRMGGVLFLGPSETPADISDEFDVVDNRWRLYRKRRDVRLPIEARLPLEVPMRPLLRTKASPVGNAASRVDLSLLATYDQLLERNMPPSVLIDESFEILHMFGDVHRLMRLKSGRPSNNLLELVNESLKSPVAGAVQHAIRKQDVVRYTGIRVGDETLKLAVEPILNPATQTTNLHLKFESVDSAVVPDVEETEVDVNEVTEKRVVALESELRYTQENLQATVEEMETANEELQASNEELVASNEELQSTNEELHSVNEELYTVNAEHQRRVEELAQANEDMDRLLATTRVGVIFLDEEFFIRRFTPEIARLFHLVEHDIGRSMAGFAANLSNVPLMDMLSDVRDSQRQLETHVTDREGTPFLLRIVPFQQHNEFSGIVLTLVDVAELKRAEQQARESAEWIEAILDTTTEGIYGVDLEGNCNFCNEAALKFLGYASEEDVLGKNMHDLIHHTRPDGSPFPVESCRIYQASRADHTIHVDDECFFRADGTSFPVEYWSRALVRHGKRQGAVVTFQDITARRETQLQLEQAHQAAQQASEAKSAFLANMSHELRTPMTAVLGFAEILECGCDDPFVVEHAGTIRRHGNYLSALLDDILDLSKVEAGKLNMEAEPVDIRLVIDEVRSLMNVRAASKGVPLRFEWKSKVPKQITADQVRVRQILVNLIGNALKFTDDGEVCVSVEFDQSERAVVAIRVRDTGIGMSNEQMQRLFQPFEQANQETGRRFGGTGLGLSISHRLAIAMNAKISVESELGKGSCFTLSLPVTAEESKWLVATDELPHLLVQNPRRNELPALSGRVLVADDQVDIRRVTTFFLERCGAEVAVAEDGRQAVDAAVTARDAGHPFDLILMDIQMPVMTGREAVTELRRLKFDCPIVALTADAMDGQREECLKLGCDGFFAKPVDAVPLMELVASLMGIKT